MVSKEPGPSGQGLGKQETGAEPYDPEFEAALTAALALDPTERIERLGQLADELKKELG
ncbi:hypothetical protein [Rothia nasisuis]|uniref:hypothetical protein n=1 Tax=Rothia nasisuis TaxID=2109647 RepID=UPI001F1BF355|nr:hypothetical protein [Rothia nasisuis]